MNAIKNKIAYADCFSGISGDMILGALVDAGLELENLQGELAKLDLQDFTISSSRQQDHSLTATKIVIESQESKKARTWKDIRSIIEQSGLEQPVKEKSLQTFTCLAEAEAKIHGCLTEDVHFHEVGGTDTIIDIVGTISGLELLGINHIITSPLPMPRGWVSCEHGMLPLPSPAVCEILNDVPVYGSSADRELVTPTGAALVKTLSRGFGDFPAMTISRTGYGAGTHKLPGNLPNLFRLVIGNEQRVEEIQEVEVIETNLDDWSPEGYPNLLEQLFSSGALDVTLIPVHMKKGRPGFLLSIIGDPAQSWEIKKCVLRETTSIGLRFRRENRMTLPREKGTVDTPWGTVMVKRVQTPSGPVLYPEYEDCHRLALENKVPLKDVYAAVNRCKPEEFVKKKE
jgi:uncharacterized protein (TIGR00299 family) protein